MSDHQKLFRNKYRITSTRLPERDYRNIGAYFVTFNIKDRAPLFGEIIHGEMILSDLGCVCDEEIIKTGILRENLVIDTYVVMPDHVHVIVMITDKITKNIETDRDDGNMRDDNPIRDVETPRGASQQDGSSLRYYKNSFGPQPPGSLAVIINQMKGAITRRIRTLYPDIGFTRQSSYYERIIRNERELNATRQYIINNPKKREIDTGLGTIKQL